MQAIKGAKVREKEEMSVLTFVDRLSNTAT